MLRFVKTVVAPYLSFQAGRTEQFLVKGFFSGARKLFIYGRPSPAQLFLYARAPFASFTLSSTAAGSP